MKLEISGPEPTSQQQEHPEIRLHSYKDKAAGTELSVNFLPSHLPSHSISLPAFWYFLNVEIAASFDLRNIVMLFGADLIVK
ncbi:MAG: hypothetical protein KI786_03125 [Mameliella sp.]|nr:hypothetical protein [Phaeodactylibacter sp.]